jgi:hypothetical protein
MNTTWIAGFLMLLSATSSSATTCVVTPLKPVRHVCGIVINQAGERIPNARLTLLQGKAELVTVVTGADGKFEFEALEVGNYELRALGDDVYLAVQSPIRIVRPTAKCKQRLQVMLPVGSSCGGGIAPLPGR